MQSIGSHWDSVSVALGCMVFIHACPHKGTSLLDKHDRFCCCGLHFFTLTSVPVSFHFLPCVATEQPNCDDAGSEERKRQSDSFCTTQALYITAGFDHLQSTLRNSYLLQDIHWPQPLFRIMDFLTSWKHYVKIHSDESIYRWKVDLEESWQTLT